MHQQTRTGWQLNAPADYLTPELLQAGFDEQHIESIAESVIGGADNVRSIHLLSPLEEGMLFHRRLGGGGDTYVLSTLFRVPTRSQCVALSTALQRVIDRHGILRSAYLWERLPRPVRVVCTTATLQDTEVVQLDPKQGSLEQLRRLLRPHTQRLDVQHAPIVSLQLASHPHETEWHAILRVHHLLCDYQSLRRLIAETLALAEDPDTELPTAADLESDKREAGLPSDSEAFFRHRLGDLDEAQAPFGILEVLNPTDISEAQLELSPELSQRIRRSSALTGVSPARLFHAAWALVVSATSGRYDVTFGTVLRTSQRGGSPSAVNCLGLSINTLPLRIRLANLSVKALLNHTDRELTALCDHQDVSLPEAQRCSRIAPTSPLFATLFNFRKVGTPVPQREDLGLIREVATGDAWTGYPITVTVDDQGSRYVLSTYTDARIDAHAVGHYLSTAMRSLVESLDSDSEISATSLRIIPQSEQHRLRVELNGPQSPIPIPTLIHEQFELQVDRTPDAVAAEYKDLYITYTDLNRRANQLASYLRTLGVSDNRPVAVCLHRGLDLIVAIVGILKAGGLYLPLDPSYPPERLQYMLEDAGAVIVVTQNSLKALVPYPHARKIVLDEVDAELAELQTSNLQSTELGVQNLSLLYVIYTSGSTGQPKGTAMPHVSMANLIEWHRTTRLSKPDQRVLQFAAISFDVAFQEIFSTLCSGGTLVLLDEWIRRDARALAALLNESSIDMMFVPPMMLAALAEVIVRGAAAVPNTLKDVITAGEQLRITPEIRRLFALIGNCRLHNHYGPTETHVVTALTMPSDSQGWPDLPTIGRPISNTQIYLLDSSGRQTPYGALGEIYIGGANLARGYLGRHDLTAARFVADPFSNEPGTRLYRTGDLGRWIVDGTLEYLGRNDDQVKIRGFRIELGEIEAMLATHVQVRAAAVTAHESPGGERCLVAYISTFEQPPGIGDLREYLMQRLPPHMVPNAFVTLSSLPVTPSGKLDKRSLPKPDFTGIKAEGYQRPLEGIETAVATMWAEVLHAERVGRFDNFFHLGGHSLLAARVVARVGETFDIQVSLMAIFQMPTLVDFSTYLVGEIQKQTLQKESKFHQTVREHEEQIANLDDATVLAELRELEIANAGAGSTGVQLG